MTPKKFCYCRGALISIPLRGAFITGRRLLQYIRYWGCKILIILKFLTKSIYVGGEGKIVRCGKKCRIGTTPTLIIDFYFQIVPLPDCPRPANVLGFRGPIRWNGLLTDQCLAFLQNAIGSSSWDQFMLELPVFKWFYGTNGLKRGEAFPR